jgi:anti-sigma28 factor (negative regulator of flagellin synthesis)
MDKREETNRRAAEHVARLRKAIEAGKLEIDRQHRMLDETRSFLSELHNLQEGEAA